MKQLMTVLVIALFVTGMAFGETIKLRDGTTVSGRILSQDEDTIVIKTDVTNKTIMKSQVDSIDYGGVQFCTVLLKDGTTLKGSIVSQDEDQIMLKTDLGEISVPKTKITSVSFNNDNTVDATTSDQVAKNAKNNLAKEKNRRNIGKDTVSASSAEASSSAGFSNDEARANVETLVMDNAFRNQIGRGALIQASGNIPVSMRYEIFTHNRKSGAPLYFLLNLFFYSVGSWAQGDFTGAFIEDALWIGAGTSLYLWEESAIIDYSTGSYGYNSTYLTLFAACLLAGLVVDYYAPWGYEGEWNNQLKQGLMLTSAAPTGPLDLAKKDWSIGVPLLGVRF
jgi:sRNA-binding regulator protein Hfq